jgi:hypothetical protein
MAFSFGGKMELVTEDNILYSIIICSFLLGVFASRVGTRLFEISAAARIVQSTVYRCLLLCAKIHEDVEFLGEVKHKYMREAGMTPAQISDFRTVDRQTLNNWKESIVQRMILTAPPTFSFMIRFTNWREAMQQLEHMHDKE